MLLKEREQQQNEQKEAILYKNKILTEETNKMSKQISELQTAIEVYEKRYEQLWNRFSDLEQQKKQIKEQYKHYKEVSGIVIVSMLLFLIAKYCF